MRRRIIRTTIVVAIVALVAALASAPLGATKPTTSPAKGPKTTVGQPKGVKPAQTTAPKGPSTAPKGPSTSKGSTMKSANATAPKGSSKKTSTTAASSTTSGTGSTPTTTTPLYTNDVALKVSTKPVQLAKLEQALHLTAGTLTTNPDLLNGATSGIKNFGQMNAMVNTVLHNPTVEFADLKLLMTGMDMTGKKVEGQTIYSLGQAKQQLGIADDGDAPTTTTSSSTTTTTGKAKKKNNSGGTE